jgi:hypothetical protein
MHLQNQEVLHVLLWDRCGQAQARRGVLDERGQGQSPVFATENTQPGWMLLDELQRLGEKSASGWKPPDITGCRCMMC